MTPCQRIAQLDAHHRLMISAGLSCLVFAGLAGRVSTMAHIFATWDFFSLCLVAMAWITMLGANPQNVRRDAKLQDSSRTVIFVFVIVSACSSLLALGALLGPMKDLPREKLAEHLLLSITTVVSSWALVHTVFSLRYAHSFYGASREAGGAGLQFPDEAEPDYLDFAYFSFVIGMTCQVSDVQITSRPIRRLAMLHGIVSFAFNTVILALTINIISGLL